ncbi:chromosomal replication initiator protein DnaA [Spirochaeta cellobiosiphila]|uniref:chromosomal replication initiator protein DnaA n=1 Tax=Spirochaeta cellobiosiphila TaxID=504483 RepID=UPI0004248CFF|nr:chromosomal replication initiator protein DnaA [Spirochaeta cellobiosiphila]
MSNQIDLSPFWKEAINQIRKELSEEEMQIWIDQTKYHSSSTSEIILEVPSKFFIDQLKRRYTNKIEQILYEISGRNIKLGFNVEKREEAPQVIEKEKIAEEYPLPVNTKHDSKPTVLRHHPNLRSDYTFERFVIGENSNFAANAAMAIARNPGTAYNPCMIYGGVGLGKTHLMQSIGNFAYNDNTNLKIHYITAGDFIDEFVNCIRNKNMPHFKNKYRNVDVLLIDDIHDLQNKKETQEELFHTFNALYDANKQMVFTCDRPVSELKDVTERLRSRFERGLNVDLQIPNYETRLAILKKKIEDKENISITDNILEIIAKNVTTNVRDLEAALVKLSAYSELTNKTVTVEIAQDQLRHIFSGPVQQNITIDLVQRIVSDYFNLSPNDLKGKKRTKVITFPRQIAMYIVREITEFSTTEVGLEFGGRDHTTVMHACTKIEDRMMQDPTLESTINQLIRSVREYGTGS